MRFAQIKSEYEVGDLCYENGVYESRCPSNHKAQMPIYKNSTFPSCPECDSQHNYWVKVQSIM